MAYAQTTLADLRTALFHRTDAVPWWTVAEGDAAINEALTVFNLATGTWRTQVTQAFVPSDHYQSLPGSLVQPMRVQADGVPLERVSLTDLNLTIPNWRGITTATAGASPAPDYFAPVSLSLLVVHPPFATFGHTLTVDGVSATPQLADPAEFLDLGAEDVSTLLGYALHVLAFKQAGEMLVRTYPGWLELLRMAGDTNRWFARSAFYRRAMGQDQTRRDLLAEAVGPTLLDELAQQAKALGGAS